MRCLLNISLTMYDRRCNIVVLIEQYCKSGKGLFSIVDIQAEEDFEEPESDANENPAPYPFQLSITKTLSYHIASINIYSDIRGILIV